MEGGIVLTNDLELNHLLRSIRAHGWTRDLPEGSPLFERRSTDHFEAYRFILPGYNVRPMEVSGAIGREQLKKLPAMTAQRRRNLAVFQKLFEGDSRFILQRENGKSSSFSFTIILNPAHRLDRDKVFEALKDADIGFRMITGGCFLKHDVIKYYNYDVVDNGVPNADLAHDRGFFVGNFPYDLTPQLERLREVLDRACS
jgi:CDP-6-deoxy-D-xylo-4-hexulose-3-dehydrase